MMSRQTLYGFMIESKAQTDNMDEHIHTFLQTLQEQLKDWSVRVAWKKPRTTPSTSFGVWAQDPNPTEVSIGVAWAAAQGLEQQQNDCRVTPSFDKLLLPEDADRWLPDTTRINWSTADFRVPEARDRHSVSGAGVLIGHPDTGTTLHDVLVATKKVLTHRGVDLMDANDSDGPMDNALGWLQFYGHGTGTSSVIIGNGDTSAGSDVVYGVAPGAELIPYRVANTVVLAWPGHRSNLARAIELAVDEGCQVISISMGWGWGNGHLRRAVHKAYEAGVIIVSAAGQTGPSTPPPWVLAPARYPEVIAMAACNVARQGCAWSSRGRLVDLTAPGDGVWRAGWVAPEKPVVSRSWGTSYATAFAAGLAALWLERWRGDARLETRTGPDRVELFRQILYNSQLNIPTGGKIRDWGAGIADAEAILKTPLPPVGARFRDDVRPEMPAEEEEELDELALILLEHLSERWSLSELKEKLPIVLTGSPQAATRMDKALQRGGQELLMLLSTDPTALKALDTRLSEARRNFRTTTTTDASSDVLHNASAGLKHMLGFLP